MKHLSYCRLLLASLLAGGAGHPLTSYGQNISRADSLASHTPVAPAAAPVVPAGPPQLSVQEQYDARRLARVVVVRVSKPALSEGPARHQPARAPATDSAAARTFRLNDEVLLYVHDLRLALRRNRRPSSALRLYIGNIGLPMEPIQVDTIRQRDLALVRFKLVRNAETEATWQIFYHLPDKLRYDEARFNIGFAEGQLGRAYAENLTLLLVDPYWFWAGLLGLLPGLVLFFGWLALNSNFIRSDFSGLIPLDGASRQPWGLDRRYRQVPYSLAKSQVAFWTLLTIGAYLMIALVTTALPTIPAGLLGLIGISVANGVLSKLITQPAADAAPPVARKQVADSLGRSRSWLYDVLNDANGVNLSRLQFLLFNLVAGGYLLYFVWTNWSLPNFDSGLLALISISSAGFLVNKSTTSPAQPTPPTPTPGPDGNVDTSSGPGPDATSPTPTPSPDATSPLPAADEPPVADTPPAAGELPAAGTAQAGDAAGPGPEAGATQAFGMLAAVAGPAPVPSPTPLLDWQRKLAAFRGCPAVYASDPARTIFGPLPSVAAGRQLRVTILDTLRGGLTLQAVLRCDPAGQLPRNVVFLLHPTFEHRVTSAAVDGQGQATLCFFSAGRFTLVAMTDEGRTVLAFDLGNVPDAPGSFLSQ